MRYLRRVWRKLTERQVWFQSGEMQTPVWVSRWERWSRPGYYFETSMYKPEWGDWRAVGVFPEQVRDDRGRLVALRISYDDMKLGGDGDNTFWIDDPSLRKI